MAVEQAIFRYRELLTQTSKAAIHALYPHDFEVYIMALELTDGSGNLIDYLAFPILPDQITKTEPHRTNIKKSSTGVTVLTSNSFVPEQIQMKGDFGRSLKILLNPREPRASGTAFSTSRGVYNLTEAGTRSANLTLRLPIFNIGVTTGYGAITILKAIINKSNGIDNQGRPFRLFFYNLPLGESYLVAVPPSGFQVAQTLDKNMIWSYTLNLTVLAPVNSLVGNSGATSLGGVLATSLIQQSLNTVGNELLINSLV